MTDGPVDDGPLGAGPFPAWLAAMRLALQGEADAEVPCGTCTACCTSSQFVHIGPEETGTLAHIPAELLFPVPGRPGGHVLLGYDEQGHCPMLVDGACSIYTYRPRTCRTYDCRIFPATGVVPEGQPAIARRAARRNFDVSDAIAGAGREAVRAAAAYLTGRGDALGGAAPRNAVQRAVLAVEVHEAFLHHDETTGAPVLVEPGPEVIRALLGSDGEPPALPA